MIDLRNKYRIKRKDGYNIQQYLDLMNQWLILKQKNIKLDDYLYKNNWKTIAIYGMGIYGRHLVRELESSNKCKICYGIDMVSKHSYHGIKIYRMDEISETVDVVINTIIYDSKINLMIKEAMNCTIINIDELIFESYKI